MAGFYVLTRIPTKKIANHSILECGRSHSNELDQSVGMWPTGATGSSESQQSSTACRNSDATGRDPPLQSNKVRLILKINVKQPAVACKSAGRSVPHAVKVESLKSADDLPGIVCCPVDQSAAMAAALP